jgi:hypothetical protein
LILKEIPVETDILASSKKRKCGTFEPGKGDWKNSVNGRKGALTLLSKKKTRRSMAQILHGLADKDPESVFQLSEKDATLARALKQMGAKTVKHFIAWQLLNKARNGNLAAIKLFLAQIGEDAATTLKISGGDNKTPLTLTMLRGMSMTELEDIEASFAKRICEMDW